MKITQNTNVVNQLALILIMLTFVFPLPFVWIDNKVIAFIAILLIYLCIVYGVGWQYVKLEHIRITDTEIIKHTLFSRLESIEVEDIQYIASRTVYVPTRVGFTYILVGRRVLEFHTVQREYLRIFVDMYETDYIHNVVLEIMRLNKDIRWVA